jgi:hypothetical protein
VRVTFWTRPGTKPGQILDSVGGRSFWWSREWGTALRRLREELESEPQRDVRLRVTGGNRLETGVP